MESVVIFSILQVSLDCQVIFHAMELVLDGKYSGRWRCVREAFVSYNCWCCTFLILLLRFLNRQNFSLYIIRRLSIYQQSYNLDCLQSSTYITQEISGYLEIWIHRRYAPLKTQYYNFLCNLIVSAAPTENCAKPTSNHLLH